MNSRILECWHCQGKPGQPSHSALSFGRWEGVDTEGEEACQGSRAEFVEESKMG